MLDRLPSDALGSVLDFAWGDAAVARAASKSHTPLLSLVELGVPRAGMACEKWGHGFRKGQCFPWTAPPFAGTKRLPPGDDCVEVKQPTVALAELLLRRSRGSAAAARVLEHIANALHQPLQTDLQGNALVAWWVQLRALSSGSAADVMSTRKRS